MRNLISGLTLGFGIALALSAAVGDLNGGNTPFISLGLAAILAVGIIVEILRVRRVESRREHRQQPSGGKFPTESET